MIFSNILTRFNYALRISNRKKNLQIFVRKSERKNTPKAWKLWAMESSSGERRDLDLQMNVEV